MRLSKLAGALDSQRLRDSLTPRATLVSLDHFRDDVLTREPQNPENISMGGTRVIVEKFNSPIVFPAGLSGSAQDDWLEYLPRFDRLHGPHEAMAAVAVTHFALAPLLLGREQTLDCSELR